METSKTFYWEKVRRVDRDMSLEVREENGLWVVYLNGGLFVLCRTKKLAEDFSRDLKA